MSSSSFSSFSFEDLNFDFANLEDMIRKLFFETYTYPPYPQKINNYYNLYEICLKNFDRGLLHDLNVWKWLFNDLKFESKVKEDEWGKQTLATFYPKYNTSSTMWTGTFGKNIIHEFFTGMHKNKPLLFPNKPIEEHRFQKLQPDLYIPNEYVVEVKTSTFLTTGTANEKIYSVPMKYSEITTIFKVPTLLIVLVGNTELYFEKTVDSDVKRDLLKYYFETLHHKYIPATSLLQCISLL